MAMFLPIDISRRIILFIEGRTGFPFVKKEELMGTFCIFGRDRGVHGEDGIKAATDLARRTVTFLNRTSRIFRNSPNTMDSNFARENYIRRVLQISMEYRRDTKTANNSSDEMKKRISGDPNILANCFAQHIAYHDHDQFFEIFQPLRECEVPPALRRRLQDRMLLLGYNTKDSSSLPQESTFVPFITWLKSLDHNSSHVSNSPW
jgi:hypothetical protein